MKLQLIFAVILAVCVTFTYTLPMPDEEVNEPTTQEPKPEEILEPLGANESIRKRKAAKDSKSNSNSSESSEEVTTPAVDVRHDDLNPENLAGQTGEEQNRPARNAEDHHEHSPGCSSESTTIANEEPKSSEEHGGNGPTTPADNSNESKSNEDSKEAEK